MDTAQRRIETVVSARLRAATVPAVVAAVFAALEIGWLGVLVDGSSDGAAFVMALVLLVLIPALVAATAVLLAPRGWWRGVLIAAVAATGLAVAGVVGGVFVGDDPADPAFISWVAEGTVPAAAAAVVLTAVGAWGSLAMLHPAPRLLVALGATVIGPVVLGMFLAEAVIGVVLIALASAVVVVVLRVALGRQQVRAGG